MATTTPNNISYPTNASTKKTFEGHVQDTADSVQTALNTKANLSGATFTGNVAVSASGTLLNASNGTITAATSAAGKVPVVAKGAASQTANLQEWQNSSAAVLASVSSAGVLDAQGHKTNGVSVVPKFIQVVSLGSLGTNYSFTLSEKSTCQFAFSSTGYSSGGGTLGTWTLTVNGSTVAQSKHFFNPSGTHMASLTATGAITLNAGTYNASVSFNLNYDYNDFCTIWATAIPVA